jgi:hypothetical protein
MQAVQKVEGERDAYQGDEQGEGEMSFHGGLYFVLHG